MKANMIEEAKNIINLQNFKAGIKVLEMFLPQIAKITRKVYDAYINEKFTKVQAFEMAQAYTFQIMFDDKVKGDDIK